MTNSKWLSSVISDMDTTYTDTFDSLLDALGRNITVSSSTEVDCPNCGFDNVSQTSNGQYSPDSPYPEDIPGPIPFTGICPVCIPKNTMITTLHGPEFIQNIKIGDNVLSRSGYYNKVKKIYTRQYQGEFVTIKPWGNSVGLTCTCDHPIYVIENGTCKKDGRESKYCFGLTNYHKNCIDLKNIMKKRADQIKVGDIVITPIPQKSVNYYKWLNVNWNKYHEKQNKKIINFPHSTRSEGQYQNNKYLFSGVREIQHFNKSQTVYNLQVEKEHNYVANGILVGNCGGAGKYKTTTTSSIKCLIRWLSSRDRYYISAGMVEPFDVELKTDLSNWDILNNADNITVDGVDMNIINMRRDGFKTVNCVLVECRKK